MEQLPETTREREQRVSDTFVALADTLVAGFDIAEFLSMLAEECVELLEVSAAGVILRAPDGSLRVSAASSQRSELLELFAVQTDAGPCIECVRTGRQVGSADLTVETQRWPRFSAAAHECGYRAVQAVPLRLREQIIGVLALLDTEPGALATENLRLGQALADVAAISILQHRALEHSDQLAGQLQHALNSRIVIEQAKGVLAARAALTMDEAFALLRGYARAHNRRLSELAGEVTTGNADLTAILNPTPTTT